MTVHVLKPRTGDARICTKPERSFTLPARAYTDPSVLEAEKEAIFTKSWWCAGHRSRLAKAGDYITTEIFDQGIVVVRGKDGALRAFYNVCQHRGHELVKGDGSAKALVCPYHAWTYNIDGTLKTARLTKSMPDFERCKFDLKPVRVAEMCGFVFVNLDPDAEPLAKQMEGLEAEIRKYCPHVDDLVFAHRDRFEIAANWKVVIDNFLECYHCHPAHKDFVDLVDMESYRNIVSDNYVSQISEAARTTNKAYQFNAGAVDFGYAGWYVWPNLTIWVYPGDPNISSLIMMPSGPERTLENLDWFLPSPEPSEQIRAAMRYMNETLQPEDIALCESVQRGLKSKGYNQGRFVIDPANPALSEHGVHHFQAKVGRALGMDIADA